MDYVLYAYALALLLLIWVACYTLGGQSARMVLTLGAYRFHPGYRARSGPNRLLRGHPDHRQRRVQAAGLMREFMPFLVDPELTGMSMDDITVVLHHLSPPESLIVRAELSEDGTGAEHWGALLEDMNTEEREIFNLEMVLLHEEAMPIQREAFADLDEYMADFEAKLDAILDAGLARQMAVIDRYEAAVSETMACGWETAQYRLVSV